MATGQIASIPSGSGGGLSTIQDLYNLINGQTTTTTGGTTTTNDSISQDGMNAMLQNALGSTNGLAAISSGQRAAGGYGSSTNTMLTNDLLTRTAGQIAANNRTTTVTKPDVTTTVGGASVPGVAKTAGFLSALQALGGKTGQNTNGGSLWSDITSGVSKQFKNLTGSTDSSAASDVSTAPIDPVPQAGGPMNYTSSSGGGGSGLDVSSLISPVGMDSTATTTDNTAGASAPVDVSSSDNLNTDQVFAADGGLIRKGASGKPFVNLGSAMNPVKLADGGSVSKKSLSILGTNQFNSAPDQAQTIAGQVSPTVNAQDAPSQVANSDSSDTSVSGVSGSGGSSGAFTSAGNSVTDPSVNSIAKGLNLMVIITGNSTLANAGAVGVMAGQSSLANAGMNIANIATSGAIGKGLGLAKTVIDPSLGNVTDTLASMNPVGAITNAALSVAGLGTLGDIASNAKSMISPNQMMTPDQQQIAASYNANLNQTNSDSSPAPSDVANSAIGNVSGSGATQDAGTPSSSSDSSGSQSTSGSIGGGTTSAANGGEVDGPGTTTSDSIHAQLSDGEYVLPADIVKMLGVDNLDKLLADHHVPAAVQKLQAFGKGK